MSELVLNLGLWPRQMEAFESPATEILFGGASEGGKSHLMRVVMIALCFEVPGLICRIIRKGYDDVLKNHMEGRTGFRALLQDAVDRGIVKINEAEVRWVKSGAVIFLEHCQDERKLLSAQGKDTHVLGIDEAPQIKERIIRFLRGWVRMSVEMQASLPAWLKGRLPRIFYTGNPIGESVGFFRRHFVKARPPFAIEKVEGFTRQYIPSRAQDNLSVDLEAHIGRLSGLGDAALIKAMDEGDWDAPVGDFFKEWDESRHVIPDLIPPAHWYRYRAFDWGMAEPFAVYWVAQSDGEQFNTKINRVDAAGLLTQVDVTLWFPKGALIIYREWYGCDEEKPDKGISMRNTEIAAGILERSPAPEEKELITLTDSYVFPDRGDDDGETIADVFKKAGVPLTLGKTSRVTGWSQMRSRLIGMQPDARSPKRLALLFVCSSCTYARDYIPALPRHPNEAKKEDAAEHGESTHSCDAIRLACMAHEIVVTAPITPEQEQKHMRAVEAKMQTEITFEQAIEIKRKERTNGHARY